MKVTVEIAAKALGCSEQMVRVGIQRGTIPIGTAIKADGKYFKYIIPEYKLCKYIGCEPCDLEKYQ